METDSVAKELAIPAISQEDKVQIVLADFLSKARTIGISLTVRDLEPVLPAFGIPLHGSEHLLLVLTDHDALSEQKGTAPDMHQLIADYPQWKKEIESDFKIRSITMNLHNQGSLLAMLQTK